MNSITHTSYGTDYRFYYTMHGKEPQLERVEVNGEMLPEDFEWHYFDEFNQAWKEHIAEMEWEK